MQCFPLTGGGVLSVYFNFRKDHEQAEMTLKEIITPRCSGDIQRCENKTAAKRRGVGGIYLYIPKKPPKILS